MPEIARGLSCGAVNNCHLILETSFSGATLSMLVPLSLSVVLFQVFTAFTAIETANNLQPGGVAEVMYLKRSKHSMSRPGEVP
jgi:hypothetical protein